MTYKVPNPSVSTPGPCSFDLTNKAQLLFTIDQSTILGSSYVKNITYNQTTTFSTSGVALSSVIYSGNII